MVVPFVEAIWIAADDTKLAHRMLDLIHSVSCSQQNSAVCQIRHFSAYDLDQLARARFAGRIQIIQQAQLGFGVRGNR